MEFLHLNWYIAEWHSTCSRWHFQKKTYRIVLVVDDSSKVSGIVCWKLEIRSCHNYIQLISPGKLKRKSHFFPMQKMHNLISAFIDFDVKSVKNLGPLFCKVEAYHTSCTRAIGRLGTVLLQSKNSALYLWCIVPMAYCCKSWQLFEPNVQNYFGIIELYLLINIVLYFGWNWYFVCTLNQLEKHTQIQSSFFEYAICVFWYPFFPGRVWI